MVERQKTVKTGQRYIQISTVSNMTKSWIVPKIVINLECNENIAISFVIVQRSTRLEYYLGV